MACVQIELREIIENNLAYWLQEVVGMACAAEKVLQLRLPANYVSAKVAISLGRI